MPKKTVELNGRVDRLQDEFSQFRRDVQQQLRAPARDPAREVIPVAGGGVRLVLSTHARGEIARRRLVLEWIELTLEQPDWTRPCPKDVAVTRSYRRIEAAGGRVLRVVHRPEGKGNDVLIVTAFLDRSARR